MGMYEKMAFVGRRESPFHMWWECQARGTVLAYLKNDFVHSKRRVAFQAKLHVGMSGPWDRGISWAQMLSRLFFFSPNGHRHHHQFFRRWRWRLFWGRGNIFVEYPSFILKKQERKVKEVFCGILYNLGTWGQVSVGCPVSVSRFQCLAGWMSLCLPVSVSFCVSLCLPVSPCVSLCLCLSTLSDNLQPDTWVEPRQWQDDSQGPVGDFVHLLHKDFVWTEKDFVQRMASAICYENCLFRTRPLPANHLSTHQNFLSKYLMMIFQVIMMIMTITVITVVWLLGNVLSREKWPVTPTVGPGMTNSTDIIATFSLPSSSLSQWWWW